jgi:ribA/ribD-fused uncharacterized protein
MEPIEFYEKNKPFYEFSNFYSVQVTFNGITYPTSEHAYQAAKFLPNTPEEREYIDIISKANTPGIALILANQKNVGGYKWRTDLNPIIQKYLNLGVKMRPDWDDVKIRIMALVVHDKFMYNERLKKLLVSTGERSIAEHTHRDKFWADGADGSGKNWLGRILMALRDVINDM